MEGRSVRHKKCQIEHGKHQQTERGCARNESREPKKGGKDLHVGDTRPADHALDRDAMLLFIPSLQKLQQLEL